MGLDVIIRASQNVTKVTRDVSNSLKRLEKDVKTLGVSSLVTTRNLGRLVGALTALGAGVAGVAGIIGGRILDIVGDLERLSKQMNITLGDAYRFKVMAEVFDTNSEALVRGTVRAISFLERLDSKLKKLSQVGEIKRLREETHRWFKQTELGYKSQIALLQNYGRTNLWVSNSLDPIVENLEDELNYYDRLHDEVMKQTQWVERFREELLSLQEPYLTHLRNLRAGIQSAKNTAEAFAFLVTYLRNVKDEFVQTTLAQILFGKQATEILNIIREEGDTFIRIWNIIKSLRIDEEVLKRFAILSDFIAIWKSQIWLMIMDIIAGFLGWSDAAQRAGQSTQDAANTQKDANQSLKEFIDKIEFITKKIEEYRKKISDWFENNKDTVEAIKNSFVWLITNLPQITKVIGTILALSTALSILIKIFYVLSFLGGIVAAILSIPVELAILIVTAVITVVTAIGLLIYNNWESIKNFFKGVWEALKGVFGGIGDFLKKVFEDFVGWIVGIVTAIWGYIETIIGWVKDAFEWFKKLLGLSTEPAKETANVPKRLQPAVAHAGSATGYQFVGGRTQYNIQFNLPSHLSPEVEEKIRNLIENDFYPRLRRVLS